MAPGNHSGIYLDDPFIPKYSILKILMLRDNVTTSLIHIYSFTFRTVGKDFILMDKNFFNRRLHFQADIIKINTIYIQIDWPVRYLWICKAFVFPNWKTDRCFKSIWCNKIMWYICQKLLIFSTISILFFYAIKK